MKTLDELLNFLKRKLHVEFTKVESTNILAYGYEANSYNENLGQLHIIFKANKDGTVPLYTYCNISKKTYEDFQKAESKGKWVNANLVKHKIKYIGYRFSLK